MATATARRLPVSRQFIEGNCSRCGGFLTSEQSFDLMEQTDHFDFQVQRCVQCGDLTDPVILRNRRQPSGEAHVGRRG